MVCFQDFANHGVSHEGSLGQRLKYRLLESYVSSCFLYRRDQGLRREGRAMEGVEQRGSEDLKEIEVETQHGRSLSYPFWFYLPGQESRWMSGLWRLNRCTMVPKSERSWSCRAREALRAARNGVLTLKEMDQSDVTNIQAPLLS